MHPVIPGPAAEDMLKTPCFPRQIALCESMNWKEWSGYHAVSSSLVLHDAEYFACRNSAGLLDGMPLFKYCVRGEGCSGLSRPWP